MEIVIIGGIGDIFKHMLDGYSDEQIKLKFIKRERAKNYFEVTTDLSRSEATEYLRKLIKNNSNSKALSYVFESDLDMYYELAKASKKRKEAKK
ncbi:MAG: hypothetical protein KHY88_02800 [Erysipelotrichaceae bacterium]|nr:hypothetical protein [Erysipelotrichaceae bacterium]